MEITSLMNLRKACGCNSTGNDSRGSCLTNHFTNDSSGSLDLKGAESNG